MKYYRIAEDELRELLYAAHYAWALENGGVDNWEWNGESVNDYLDAYNTANGTQCEDIEDIVEIEVKLSDIV